jgi:hypothetical protein
MEKIGDFHRRVAALVQAFEVRPAFSFAFSTASEITSIRYPQPRT